MESSLGMPRHARYSFTASIFSSTSAACRSSVARRDEMSPRMYAKTKAPASKATVANWRSLSFVGVMSP